MDGTSLTVVLTRPVAAASDDDLSLDKCRHLILADGSGVQQEGFTFGKHASTPVISEDKMCLTAQGSAGGNPSGNPSGARHITVSIAVLLTAVFMALCY